MGSVICLETPTPGPQERTPATDSGNAPTSLLLRTSKASNSFQDSASRTFTLETASTGTSLSPHATRSESGAGAAQLALQFMGLADALSRRYSAPGCETEDLQQVARLGLVKAARRYRESGNHGFIAFAVPTITGELKRYLRDHSWVVRPPRPIQEARLRIRQVRPELTQRLGKAPSTADLSVAAGLSVADTTLALMAERAMVAQPIEQNDASTSYEDRVHAVLLAAVDPGYERVEQKLTLEVAMRDASEEDRRLLHLRFVLEFSQGQIAQEFGVSQMQISRRLQRLLDRLGRRLTESTDK